MKIISARNLIPVFVLTVLLSAVGFAAAQQLGIEISPEERTVNLGKSAVFEITVTNDFGNFDEFYLFVTGSPSNWINIDSGYLRLPPHSSSKVDLGFYPNDQPGVYEYEVFFQSVNDPSRVVSRKVMLKVLGEKEDRIDVIGHDISKGEIGVSTEVDFLSTAEKEVLIDYSVSGDSGKIIITETLSFTVDGAENITHIIPIPADIIAGMYTVKVKVRNTGDEFQNSFDIQPVHDMKQVEEARKTPLFDETKITVSNEGNVVEKEYRIVSNVPTGFVTFSQPPSKCQDSVCEWILSKLNPEESAQIVFRLEYWPLFAQGLLIGVLVVSFFVYGVRRAITPSLRKRIDTSSGGIYTAVIEVKNPGKRISNVVIRDEVSPLFKVSGAFDTVKPEVRETEAGTEIVWSLPEMEPKDHRILHYTITPLINGHLKVPGASMRYLTSRGRKAKADTRERYISA